MTYQSLTNAASYPLLGEPHGGGAPPGPLAIIRKWPLFVVGCHRSGTTLARYLLAAHPNLACPPESKFIAGLESFVSYPQALRGLASLGITTEAMMDRLRILTCSVFDDYASRHGKPRWVDKTPNYARLMPFIDRLLRGEVLYAGLVRHPLDTIASLERMRAFAIAAPEDPDVRRAVRQFGRGRTMWGRYWLEMTTRLVEFASSHPDRCLLLRYEDLTADAERMIRLVLTFIGEEMPADLVAKAFMQSHPPGYEDPNIRRSRDVHRRSIGRWMSWPAAEILETWPIVAPLAVRLGYTCASSDGSSIFSPTASLDPLAK